MKTVPEITLLAMQADMNRMSSLGTNLANSLTPGYQRQVVVQRPVGEASFAQRVDRGMSLAGGVELLNDARAGTLKATGAKLDVALVGAGYFEVETPEGLAYTRAGNFQIDARGRLVSAQGHAVMGQAGEIFLTQPNPVIDAQGVIREGDKRVGQLKMVQFDNPQSLTRMGEGLFAPGANGRLASEADTQVRQGHLENANVSHVHEMLLMMQTLRHFESVQRVAQSYDAMLGSAISKLGTL